MTASVQSLRSQRGVPAAIRHLAIGLLAALVAPSALAAEATRVSSFEYHPTTRQLSAEIVEPDKPEFAVRTAYQFDSFGNRIQAQTANFGVGVPTAAQFATRTSTSVFNGQNVSITVNGSTVSVFVAPGLFPTQTTNAANHSESRTYDPRTGSVVALTGPNGLTTTFANDDFGRKVSEVRADGTRTVWRYCYLPGKVADTTSNSAGCTTPAAAPAAAVMYVEAEPRSSANVKNGPYQRVYSDLLGREVRTETESFDGNAQAAGVIVNDTAFNAYGATVLITQPYFFANANQSSLVGGTAKRGASETAFDALGRKTHVWVHDAEAAAADLSPTGIPSSLTRYEYDGLEQREISVRAWRDANNATTRIERSRSTLKDGLGRVMRVTDPLGAQLSYQYDAFDNLVATRDSLGNVTTATFNIRGQRLGLNDPSTGLYTYSYDALGQLKTQQSPVQRAASQTTSFSYDVLGRRITRATPEYTTTWSYDKYANASACTKGVGKLCQVVTNHGIDRKLTYDSLGRLASSLQTVTNGPSFSSSTTYDATHGRVTSQTYPSGLVVGFSYTALGYLERQTQGAATLWQALRVNAFGRVDQWAFGNGVQTSSVQDPLRGHVLGLQAGLSASPTAVMNHSYAYDTIGNLTDRADANAPGATLTEAFTYDTLDRLTQYRLQGGQVVLRAVSLQYNALGSLLYKSDVGAFRYPTSGPGSVRPHAVQEAGGATYGYDANGNMVTASAGKYQSVAYTSFNLPDDANGLLGRNNTRYTWRYGPDHERVMERRVNASGTRTTWYLHPDNAGALAYEQEVSTTGQTTHRHYLSAASGAYGVLTTTAAAPTTVSLREFWHRDHLGSVVAITDANGAVTQRMGYDPFGKRRDINGSYDPFGNIVIDVAGDGRGTDRGFTGHEHLDDVGVIHMNGRLYDPHVARFMQTDPVIQEPMELQNYNRYSYVLNNPLRFTDPTGQFFHVLIALAASAEVATAMITALELTGIQAIAVHGFMTGVLSSFATGANPLRAGVAGAFSSVASFSLAENTGGHTTPSPAANPTIWAAKVFGHAAIGCVGSAISGGKCKSGAAGAGATTALSPVFGDLGNGPSGSELSIPGVMLRALVGGLAAKASGGKFANGAVAAAFQYLYNDLGGHFESSSGSYDSGLLHVAGTLNAAQAAELNGVLIDIAIEGTIFAATGGSGSIVRLGVRSAVQREAVSLGDDLAVGTYNQLSRANTKSGLRATHSPHHVIQDAVSNVSTGRGAAISLRKDLHEETRTFGRKVDLGDNRRNLAADVRNLRNILRRAGYERELVNVQMKELIKLNRYLGNIK